MSDITGEQRHAIVEETRARMQGKVGDIRRQYLELAAERDVLRAEVERLRMTDAEHEAVRNAARWLVAIQAAGEPPSEHAATLRALAERHGRDGR